MVKSKALYEEVIDEIGTQTLARFGLNIFSLNTYGAYGASVTATNIVSRTYDIRNKSESKDETLEKRNIRIASSRGYVFEDLDVGQKNIMSELLNKGQKTYTTDELADIKKVADIIASNKKIDKLNSKDRQKFNFVMNNYKEEVLKINSSKNMMNNAKKHDPSTDTITFDEKGNIVKKSQHKVIAETEGFFEREKLYDKSGKILKDENGQVLYKKDKDGNFVYKYLENNDVLTVPFDDYKRHKENLENMIKNPKSQEDRQKAQKALDMLNKNNVTNRLMCENPKTTAVITQSMVASGHIAQAGMSDAIVVSLSMLANGAIYEIKDAFSENGSNTPIDERIKRLIKKVLEAFKEPFKRGASFGAIDVGIGILTQIFQTISSKLKYIWKELRSSLKSVFNAIWDYLNGKVKSYQELISVIIKAIFSAIMVAFAITLETKLELWLAPLVSPIVAKFLAPTLAIIVSAIAVIIFTKSIDLALNTLFGAFTQRDIAKMKAEEIKALCEEMLPTLIEDRKELEKLIETTYKERKLTFEKSFEDFKEGITANDVESVIFGLQNINSMYGKSLKFQIFDEFDEFMLNSNSVIKL